MVNLLSRQYQKKTFMEETFIGVNSDFPSFSAERREREREGETESEKSVDRSLSE